MGIWEGRSKEDRMSEKWWNEKQWKCQNNISVCGENRRRTSLELFLEFSCFINSLSDGNGG